MVVARGLGHGLGLGRWRRHATFIRAASSASSASAASPPDKKERGEAYLRRDSDIPLVKETVGQVLQRTAEKFPERPAVISYYQNKRVTFHELIKKADQLGAGLRALGLARNERVAVWGPNSLEWIIAKMACARAGLILVTLNPAFQTEEVTYCLRKANVRAVICNHTFKTQNYHKLMLAAAPDIATSTPGDIKSDVLPDLKALVVISDDLLQGALRLSEVMYAGTDQGVRELRNQQKEVDPFDVVEIQFTSGTTGAPKAAMLTHYNIVNNARIHNLRRFETGVAKTNHDIVCSLVPFFHVFASVIGILACADSGDTLLIASPHFDVKDAYQAIKTEKATVVFGAPTMFVDLLRELERNGKVGMETVQMMFSGGAIASEQLMTKMQEDLPHVQLRQGYGMTETSPAAFTIPHEVDSPKRVLTYVGELLPHLEAKVIDAQGKTVAFGEPGQLCIRGYSVCKGYWDDQEKTRDLIDAKGWLRTGDLFVLEEDGYGKIVGRIKELIIRGAENIAPREIEEVLAKHPNVLEVAVYGVPDERMGEELAAVIRLRDTSVPFTIDDMKEFLKGKVAYFKIPRYMDVLDDFPKNASGKVQKFKLQDAFVKRLKGTK